jgi:hypothetical protein
MRTSKGNPVVKAPEVKDLVRELRQWLGVTVSTGKPLFCNLVLAELVKD